MERPMQSMTPIGPLVDCLRRRCLKTLIFAPHASEMEIAGVPHRITLAATVATALPT